MKDAAVILKKAATIKESVPSAAVTLETTAPICSKSIKFLKKNGINAELIS